MVGEAGEFVDDDWGAAFEGLEGLVSDDGDRGGKWAAYIELAADVGLQGRLQSCHPGELLPEE